MANTTNPTSGVFRLLRSQASRYAISGVLIAVAAVIIATVLQTWVSYGAVTLDGMIQAQKSSPLLWMINLLPFVYAVWGQYASMSIAFRVGSVVADQAERTRKHISTLEYRALHDPVTELPNSLLFHDRLNQAVQLARREGRQVSVIAFEIDRFRDVNERHGTDVADQVLRAVADRLTHLLRESDTVAHTGGGQFVVLGPTIADRPSAERMAERIQQAFREPVVLGGELVTIRLLQGIALYPEHGGNPEDLLQNAFTALYQARDTKRNYAVFDAGTAEGGGTSGLARYGRQLREAVEDHQLGVNYVPRVVLASNELHAAEARIFWNHPDRGRVEAGEFMPVAEQLGLMRPLTLSTLEQALADQCAWSASGLQLKLSYRISAFSLFDDQFVSDLDNLLLRYGVQPRQLTISVTERALAIDRRLATGLLEDFNKMGVRIALDDFGHGPSSLLQVVNLPVSEVRLSRGVVVKARTNEQSAAFVRSVVEFAHTFGWTCVADGVDDEQTWELLMACGCDQGQGSYIGQPFETGDLAGFAQARSAVS